MHIDKIEVPAFRVLRDVVLDFGETYDPQVFPIGSENGGGKSTLLQLVFVLLHCSAPPRLPYLENLLASDFHDGQASERIIARLALNIEGERFPLEFVSLSNQFLAQRLPDPINGGFDISAKLRSTKLALREFEERMVTLRDSRDRLQRFVTDKESTTGRSIIDGQLVKSTRDARLELTQNEQEIENLRANSRVIKALIDSLNADAERIQGLLIALNYRYITNHECTTPTGPQPRALICRCAGLSAAEVAEVLGRAAYSIFLLGPSNQQYLFLAADTRKALLKATPRSVKASPARGSHPTKPHRPQIEYLTRLDAAEGGMKGFYAYDWLSVDPLVKLFAAARDEDFKNMVKTGSYGANYTTMMREVNGLLLGKRVRPLDDLSGVEFIVTDDKGLETALSPEDLSQGELKRLMIYAWLRASNAVDAVVLIDEIEASFHPDWQVGIVRDLQDWAPRNQYLLATHSYELCQALTPGHVRELQPRLRRGGGTPDDASNSG